MENPQNKNSSPLPLELLFDLIKAVNINNKLINDYTIGKTKLELKWKEYATKLSTSSLLFYTLVGENFRKMFIEFKLTPLMESCILCGNELSASQPSLATSCLHKFHLNCIVPYFINNNNCPALGCDSVAAKEIEIGWDCSLGKSKLVLKRVLSEEIARADVDAKKKKLEGTTNTHKTNKNNEESTSKQVTENEESAPSWKSLIPDLVQNLSPAKKSKDSFEVSLEEIKGKEKKQLIFNFSINVDGIYCNNMKVKLIGNLLLIILSTTSTSDNDDHLPTTSTSEHVEHLPHTQSLICPPVIDLNSISASITSGKPPMLSIKAWRQ
uniref:RING-type domain-containing protein n=1 Tax=Meloidogyne enterolobii TaxID=390850 RepID=A0A6V7VQY8_MELEN|nr:unnamed protein product [Meloidogyne enterolobii]